MMDIAKPHTIDMASIRSEVATNYTGHVALTHAFLPYFQSKGKDVESAIIL